MLNIIYMGTPGFAVEPLKKIIEAGISVKAVVTAPDKPAGRGQKLSISAVKEFALQHNLPVLQPIKLKDEAFINELKALNADLFVVVAFRMLPEIVWQMPPKGTVNLHASLLPQYRGAAPINWAIINGEKETGVTTFFIKHEIDTGNIILQEKISIEDKDDAGLLHDKLMHLGANLLVKTIHLIDKSQNIEIEQDKLIHNNLNLKHAPKIFKPDCRLNWHESPENIHNKVRGLSPYPGAWTLLNKPETEYKIFRTQPTIKQHNFEKGMIETDNKSHLRVYCHGGYLDIIELQASGKKRMNIAEYLRGYKFAEGSMFE